MASCATIASLTIAAQMYLTNKISTMFTDCFAAALVSPFLSSPVLCNASHYFGLRKTFYVASAICDIEIAVSMVYYVNHSESIMVICTYYSLKAFAPPPCLRLSPSPPSQTPDQTYY